MRRYWIEESALDGDVVRLEGPVLHHIRDVCRMRIGSKFEVLVSKQAYLVEILTETKHESVARVIETRTIEELRRPHIHLALSVPRFAVFDAIAEKAVELGVTSIQPLFSDHSFIRRQEDTFAKKKPRLEKIVIGATQQSGRGDLMPIQNPIWIDDFLAEFNQKTGAAGLFAYEGEAALDARAGLAALGTPGEVWIFVGSEGGFSHREVELFGSHGLQPVTLGAQVLRVETACVALVSIIKYAFDLMR